MVVLAEYSEIFSDDEALREIAIISEYANYDNEDPNQEFEDELSLEQIFGIGVTAVMVPFILISNILVIVSVKKFRRLQIPTNYFLVSLSAADIIIGLIIPFFMAVEVLKSDIPNIYACLTPNRVLVMACGVSILTLAIIAYDRYAALLYPLEYVKIMTERKVALLIFFSWIFSAVISWLPLFLHWYDGLDDFNVCSFKLLYNTAHVLFLSVVFGPACFIIFYCYSRIYSVAKHHARAIAAVEQSVRHNLEMRYIVKDTKCAKTLGLVIGVFLCLWLPYFAFLVIDIWLEQHLNDWLRNYLALLAFFNSGLNPWVYAYKNSEFRAAFRRILKQQCLYRNCGIPERRNSTGSVTSIFQESGHDLCRVNSRVYNTDVYNTKPKMAATKLPGAGVSLYQHFLTLPHVGPHSLFPTLVKAPISSTEENSPDQFESRTYSTGFSSIKRD